MIWLARIGSIGPKVVCKWDTSEVKDSKFTIPCERERKRKPVKQCKLTSQVKKTKQKEEKYKNTNKMSDVRIMKNIIIHIYNNLQVLWSSRVKFVSLSQLLGCPLFGCNSGVFAVPDFIVSPVWIKKKKKKEGRRDIKGNKEGIEQERRKERKKVLKGKKILKKKKKPPAGFKLAKSILLVFLVAAGSGGLIYLFSIPDQHSGGLQPSSPAAPGLAGSFVHPPQGYGWVRGLFCCVTLPGALDMVSGPLNVCTLPGVSDLGSIPRSPPRECQVATWRGDWSCCCRIIPQTAPECVFLFEKILLLNRAAPFKEGPVLSHSPPLHVDWGQSRSWPDTAQLSTLPSQCPQSPWDYHFVLIPLPATSSNQLFLGAAQTLFVRGGSH